MSRPKIRTIASLYLEVDSIFMGSSSLLMSSQCLSKNWIFRIRIILSLAWLPSSVVPTSSLVDELPSCLPALPLPYPLHSLLPLSSWLALATSLPLCVTGRDSWLMSKASGFPTLLLLAVGWLWKCESRGVPPWVQGC